MALDVDILILRWSPTAVGAAIAARDAGLSVAAVGLAVEGGIRGYWRIGPTPLADGSLSGHEYEDVAIATLRARGAHAFPDAFMAGGTLHGVAMVQAQPSTKTFAGSVRCRWPRSRDHSELAVFEE